MEQGLYEWKLDDIPNQLRFVYIHSNLSLAKTSFYFSTIFYAMKLTP